jgi:hypothetical protein
MRFKAIAFATAGLVFTASLAIAQATQTLTGTVSAVRIFAKLLI